MGWWPTRVCVLLNIVIFLGYGLVDSLIAGQILAAVNSAGMGVVVGVIVAAIITLAVCLFGIRVFHTYERYAFIPQLIVLFVLVGSQDHTGMYRPKQGEVPKTRLRTG